MEIRHLRYFIVVAEELHFSRAARRLNMAQPPLSQQIQQLEKELGTQLFFRTNHQVKLTDAGKFFLKSSYKILKDLDRTCLTAREIAKGEMGRITVGFTSTAIFDVMPKLIQAHQKKYPNIRIRVKQLNTTPQLKLLLKNKIDIGILCANSKDPNLASAVICREPLYVALPKDHDLVQKRDLIEIRELSNESFIMTTKADGEDYYNLVMHICQDAGFTPNIVQEVHELHIALSFVSDGIGVALVPMSLQKFHMSNVIYKPLKDSLLLETVIVWKKEEHSLLIDNFLKVARDVL